jgi:hypothetical protein
MTSDHPRNTGPMRSSRRCGAKTRLGKPCNSPAVAGKFRCRMHGGAKGSGGGERTSQSPHDQPTSPKRRTATKLALRKPEVPEEAHPKYIFISDSIIISVPFKALIEGVDGLDILVVKCTEVAQKILELGLLVRGGVSVGNVWHDDTNIFGTGYIDAYETEKKAKHPRIVLSGAASAHWRQDGRFAPDLCLPDDGVDIIDILSR